jgi:hypothetical protein
MRRLHGAFTALALAAIAVPAGAAEITRIATSAEPGNPFDLDLGVRWDRTVESATITREKTGTAPDPGVIVEGDRLRYLRTRNAIVPRIAIGLWRDVELHAEVPYVLGDDQQWRYGMHYGHATGPGTDSISTNSIDANGNPCVPGPCPIFPVDPTTTDYHGGRAGDLKIGIAWGVFNDRKDDTKPFWLVGLDVTAPTATRWDPGKNRTTDTWYSPYRVQANPGPIGEKIWKWDFYTALSKRYRYFDPYVKAHAQLALKSASTYSNCDAVDAATVPGTVQQMNSSAVAACAASASAAGAKLPFVAGMTVGTEVIPYEDARESQKLALDFRLYGDVTTSQRFYNELTAATGKLLQTEGYLEMGALAGLYLRASKYVLLTAQASIATRTSHYLTGESDTTNPNFDWRYDAPGRRFRISEVSIFELSFGGVLQF